MMPNDFGDHLNFSATMRLKSFDVPYTVVYDKLVYVVLIGTQKSIIPKVPTSVCLFSLKNSPERQHLQLTVT